MSSSKNSAPADLTICGSPGTRNSHPNAPNTGSPASSFCLIGFCRIAMCVTLLVPLPAPRGVAERFVVHHVSRAAPIREIDSRCEGAFSEQPHALVRVTHGVRRDDHVVEPEQRIVGRCGLLLEHIDGRGSDPLGRE